MEGQGDGGEKERTMKRKKTHERDTNSTHTAAGYGHRREVSPLSPSTIYSLVRLLNNLRFEIGSVINAYPGREADHSPSTCTEVKKMCIYTSTPPYVFMA
jgi:hypothetical protein